VPAAAGLLPWRPERVAARPLVALTSLLPDVVWTGAPAEGIRLTGVTLDSRSVRPGDLYAALPGSSVHGGDFVAAARSAGAVAVLTDPAGRHRAERTGLPVAVVADPRARLGGVAAWVYGRPGESMLLIGVTGTNGKTTTAYLLEAGLRAAGHSTGMIGTVETRIAGAAIPSVRTTPEAPDLQALLARMREQGVDAVAMEVSSHALALGRVDGLRLDVAIFTNLSHEHLDFHPDMASYFATKASLFTADRAARGVVNIDDPYGERLAATAPIPVTRVSAAGDTSAQWRGVRLDAATTSGRFELQGPGGTAVSVGLGLPGRFNVDNAALALAALVEAGVPVEAAAAGLASVRTVAGRMERVDAGQPFLAVVDYAHTPEAVRSLLAALRSVTSGRLIVVLGCGGDRDREKRPEMGAAAVTGADVVIFTTDNPRSEDPAQILVAMLTGAAGVPGPGRTPPVVEPDRAAAIGRAVEQAGPGDTVVVAGKGHEQGQELADGVVPFDDRSVLATALGRVASRA